MSTVAYAHLAFTDTGVPIIAGARTKVIEIAMDYVAHRWEADEIHRQHPHLSRGQIHSALAYYFDHHEEMDRQIAEQIAEVEAMRQESGPSAVLAKARQLGLRP
ncbi:MAG: DUF433 domain-containing protein [Planctomycetaceae bacterium]|nr:DUF433 domain-containing protein [Planctomycetaceae bacterium]